jgi:polyhydroxyalkanoate synthesis regulator phasin
MRDLVLTGREEWAMVAEMTQELIDRMIKAGLTEAAELAKSLQMRPKREIDAKVEAIIARAKKSL